MSKAKKESFFWTSYSDLMTSLFFIMLVLFVLTIALLHKRISEQNIKLEEFEKIEEIKKAINEIDPSYFEYNEKYKKHVLKIKVNFYAGQSNIYAIDGHTQNELLKAGKIIQQSIEKISKENPEIQYLLIIEGQSSKDYYEKNYELSYERALALSRFWKNFGIDFGKNCEVLISGSGTEGSMRDALETNNQRFLIHIIPKTGIINTEGKIKETAKANNVSEKAKERSVPDNMVRIQGGIFIMGSPDNEAGRYNDEAQHRVTVNSFYMTKYPVTQKEYEEVMGVNPSKFKDYNSPVENVNWYEAVEYCNKRSLKEELSPAYKTSWFGGLKWNRDANGYRLPTEAEWEYACRAGTTTPFSTGNNIWTDQANYDRKRIYRNKTTPVGSFTPNQWGLYDMHGNVWEWCWDWYGDYSGETTDPSGASSGLARVLRGGSWYSSARIIRSANRGNSIPTARSADFGFRVVRP